MLTIFSCSLLNSVKSVVNNSDRSCKHCLQVAKTSCNHTSNEIILLHKRFDHRSTQVLMHLLKSYTYIKQSQEDLKLISNTLYEACQLGKVYKLYFSTSETNITQELELIHTDL